MKTERFTEILFTGLEDAILRLVFMGHQQSMIHLYSLVKNPVKLKGLTKKKYFFLFIMK